MVCLSQAATFRSGGRAWPLSCQGGLEVARRQVRMGGCHADGRQSMPTAGILPPLPLRTGCQWNALFREKFGKISRLGTTTDSSCGAAGILLPALGRRTCRLRRNGRNRLEMAGGGRGARVSCFHCFPDPWHLGQRIPASLELFVARRRAWSPAVIGRNRGKHQ